MNGDPQHEQDKPADPKAPAKEKEEEKPADEGKAVKEGSCGA